MEPLKVKIVTEMTQNITASSELQLNRWLAENPDIEIIQMLQSESMAETAGGQLERNLTITVVYRETQSDASQG